MSRLAIFDIDGTLVDVDEVPSFVEAFRRTHGFQPEFRWEHYRTSTDTGIVGEILEERFGRPATHDEVAAVTHCFAERIRANVGGGVTPLRIVPGVREFVPALARRGWRLALATGCVEASARFKVERAGLSRWLHTGGFSEDHVDRAEILRTAVERSGPASEIVYFGDRPWDLRAAKARGIRFLGVNTREDGRNDLLRAGAALVFPDYADPAPILKALPS